MFSKIKAKHLLLGIYVIAVLSISAVVSASEVSSFIHTKSYCGEVVVDVEGRPYLIDEKQRVYSLRASVDLDWASLNSEPVQIIGVVDEIKQIGEPVFDLMSLDPLSSHQTEETDTPVLFVFNITRLSAER